MLAGDYDPIARRIFRGVKAQRFLLEYDDERSGSFECLREVPEDRTVVLGLVSTKSSELEEESELEKRLLQASKIVPLERLALSPQCGFASSVVGNRLSAEDQKRKLQMVTSVVRKVWGD